MYHCQIHLYFIGCPCRIFEIMKEMSPLKSFSHKFLESEEPDTALLSSADVIFADLQNMDDEKRALQTILFGKREETDLILLSDKNRTADVLDDRLELKDIWILPMSDREVKFRFLRWQQTYKASKDFWQTNQFLEAAINHIPNLIWYKDKNGIHEKVNDSFCEAVNKTREQVEGQGHAYIWDVEHDDPACIESEFEVINRKETCISEETIETGEGRKQLKTYKSPLYDIDGSVMGTVGVAIDITKERVYEQEIIKKNHTLERIFTTLDCGVMRHSLDGTRILGINRAALQILGYESQDELMEEGFDMVAASVVDEDKAKLCSSIMSLKKEGDSVSVGYRVQHKNGRILHVMGNVKLLQENGELCYQRFLLDCTEQKIEENRNKKHQMELLQALSIDFSIVWFLDLDTGKSNLLRKNNRKGELIEDIYDSDILFEKNMERYIARFVYEDDREMMKKACSPEQIKKELSEKKLYFVNYRIKKDDKIEYFQMKTVRTGAWKEKHSVVMGIRSVDAEMRNEMEQKSLLENALLQANKANKAKSVFLSNMSHDIRTPMNAIVGFTSLAITHIDRKEQVEEYLRKIMTSGNHLLSLINDVLDMSRIESGKMHLDEKPCSLQDILHELRNIVHADVCAKQLELYIDTVDIMNGEIYCDKLRLKQVLLNLLGNAIKYTGAGGIVSMRITEKAGAPEGYVNYEFHIKDTGIGMSEEFVTHIFEPFEREKNTTISGIQGTGLGMAITKNIVDMMNGTIEVKSEQGIGTEFTVSFVFRLNDGKNEMQTTPGRPVSEPELKSCLNTVIDVDSKQEEKEGNRQEKIRTGRILLAEDIEMNQEIASAILGDAGFCTEIAGNGEIAVDMLKNSTPGYYRLVLMDIQMPVMNGYDAAREIRNLENKELASIPIIAMTANAFEEDKKEAIKNGMNGHIAKPIDIDNLFETLDKILD